MGVLFGILAALGVFAVARNAGAGNTIVLLRAGIPFTGPILAGNSVSLLAEVRDASGTLPPKGFKVTVVGLPSGNSPNFTGVFQTDVLGAKAGEFLEFAFDKIQNVSA